ncbi:DNA-directed RNA polymerase subunit E'' [Candidatus Marsarchaeota archaeon]|nr:DNA-directed RNA polymerase subunit E'' [Candidatus Marsarchaeota archaeon]MCL5405029.1 DNA-directed RNA polymerase subunit E'' [Candidatus Marsarchaeota archaeon]
MEGLVCKKCRLLISNGSKCPICGSTDLTRKWSGYLIVLNADMSEVANELGIKINSTFALNIRD